MARFHPILPAIAVALTLAAPLTAQTAEHSACGAEAIALKTMLDLGGEERIDMVMRYVLRGDAALLVPQGTPPQIASEWFGVLFHPDFLDALTEAGEADVAAWDALATAVEAAYVPMAGS